MALINWINGEGSGIWGEAGGSISAETELPSPRAGGSWGSWEGAHDWIWMRKNWVKTEETAAFIRPPTLWSSCLICTLLLCKSVIIKRRGFFLIRERTSRCWQGFGKKCCACLPVHLWVSHFLVTVWESTQARAARCRVPLREGTK